MFKRNRRVLWLLNHKTLMPFEVGLLVDLGFEVYTPKILPPPNLFRNATVDFSHDKSLSLPPKALKRLNEFDFYESDWPDDIVELVNRYFGTVFVIPLGRQLPETLAKFEGQMLLRAFGLENMQSYKRKLETLYGPGILAMIDAAGNRFWFAEGYKQLTECEPALIARHAIFLPVGVPEAFWTTHKAHTGADRRILFVCPNIVSNSYYATVYQAFKRDFGDLPHVIVGAQDVAVDDPHVIGFVSNEELARLFRECAVTYYHSVERRHVHYSPVEAAINGMPVVYYADSLLGRMTESVTLGRCESTMQARETIERILNGDTDFIEQVRNDQLALPYEFSGPYCRGVWQRELVSTGFAQAVAKESPLKVLIREAKRILLRKSAHGLSRMPTKEPRPMPSPEDLVTAEPDAAVLRAMEDGVDFREPSYPWFVDDVNGVSFPESAGRWSDGTVVSIWFVEPLPRRFRLTIVGAAYGRNRGADVHLIVEGELKIVRFETFAGDARDVVSEWNLDRRASRIDIHVPYPTVPEGDNRALGLALRSLRIQSLA